MDALQGLGGRDGKSRGFHRSLHRNALVCQNLAAIPLPHRRYHRKHCATRTLFRQDSQLHKRRTLGSDHRGIVGSTLPQCTRLRGRNRSTPISIIRSRTRGSADLCICPMAILENGRDHPSPWKDVGGIPDTLLSHENRRRVFQRA